MSIRAALLQLLDESDAHGYQLKSEFERRTGGVWPLNVGQVYTTLDRLRRDGLVDELEPVTAGADGDGRTHRRYTITDAGRREVAAWLASGSGDKAPPRDELLTKVLVALGRSATTALAVIDTQRNLLYDELRRGQHQQRRRAAGPERLAHDALLARLDADIDWLDRCEMHITAAAAAGAGPTAPSAHPTDVSSDTTDPTDASSDPRQNEPATTDRTDPTERLS